MRQIETIYHEHHGVCGYRTMTVYLSRRGCQYSRQTIHKYMNGELKLKSLVRPKRPAYLRGKAHKIFDNHLKQKFCAEKANQKWCTDFTFLYLKDHQVRYNCSIIDLYDRSIVASITDKTISTDLAIRTLEKALNAQQIKKKSSLILHSDQGSQYTSKAFIEYCKARGVTQSMSRAGCPYDNAPMERYFNTLKNECTGLYEFRTQEELYRAVEKFAYVTYNHQRPHSYNNYQTPLEARLAG